MKDNFHTIDPSETFLDTLNFLDSLTHKLNALKDRGEEVPIVGLFLFTDKGSNKPHVISASGCFLDLDSENSKDFVLLAESLAQLIETSANVCTLVNAAMTLVMKNMAKRIDDENAKNE